MLGAIGESGAAGKRIPNLHLGHPHPLPPTVGLPAQQRDLAAWPRGTWSDAGGEPHEHYWAVLNRRLARAHPSAGLLFRVFQRHNLADHIQRCQSDGVSYSDHRYPRITSKGRIDLSHERDHDRLIKPKRKVGSARGRSEMPSWTCEICDQVVELRDDERPHWSAKAYENCKLQYHYVDK